MLALFRPFEFQEGDLSVDGLAQLLVPVTEPHTSDHGGFLLLLDKFVILFLGLGELIHLGNLSLTLLGYLDLMNRFGFQWSLSESELTSLFNITDSTLQQGLSPLKCCVTGVVVSLACNILVLENVGSVLPQLSKEVTHLR